MLRDMARVSSAPGQSQAQTPHLHLFAPKALMMSQPSVQTQLGWPKGGPTLLLVWFPKINEMCVTTLPCLLVPVKAHEPGGRCPPACQEGVVHVVSAGDLMLI